MQGYGRGRETNFGLNSEEYNQLDLIIQRLIAEEDLSLTALVEVLERNPQNRNEMVNYTPLLEE